MCATTLPDTLRATVETLASDIGERNVLRPHALRAAADYITREWRQQGYDVATRACESDDLRWANLEVTRPGHHKPREILLVGAHYDSVAGSPGANDNATGVAAMLALSRFFLDVEPERTVRFVAFVNEEPPFFFTRRMGSDVYARAARACGDDIRLMVSLETIGYYSDTPGSQRYPPLLGLLYPDRGNFIAFISNLASRRLLRRVVQLFRAHSDFPVEHLATLALVPGVAWSDHLSFWSQGYRALMVTDTAVYRDPCYHSPHDTADRLDYLALGRVTAGLCSTMAALATQPTNL